MFYILEIMNFKGDKMDMQNNNMGQPHFQGFYPTDPQPQQQAPPPQQQYYQQPQQAKIPQNKQKDLISRSLVAFEEYKEAKRKRLAFLITVISLILAGGTTGMISIIFTVAGCGWCITQIYLIQKTINYLNQKYNIEPANLNKQQGLF